MALQLILKKNFEEHGTNKHVPVEQETEENFYVETTTRDDEENVVFSLNETLNHVISSFEKEKSGDIVRLKTGIDIFDKAIGGGFENRRLYVLGGEPDLGKSLLVTQIGLNIAKQGIPVLLFSLEMGHIDIGKRVFQMHAGADCVKERGEEKLGQALSELQHTPLHICDNISNIDNLHLMIDFKAKELGVQFVIIDYFGRLTGENSGNHYEDVNKRMRMLDEIAKTYDIPILVIVSLTIKQIYYRKGDRKPTMADTRDSGQIAYDCDYLIFIWKPFDYDPNYRELILAKARFGPKGISIPLTLDEATLTFKEVQQEFPEEQEEKLPGTKLQRPNGLKNWREKLRGGK